MSEDSGEWTRRTDAKGSGVWGSRGPRESALNKAPGGCQILQVQFPALLVVADVILHGLGSSRVLWLCSKS